MPDYIKASASFKKSCTKALFLKRRSKPMGKTAIQNDPERKTKMGFHPIDLSWVRDKLLITATIARGIKSALLRL